MELHITDGIGNNLHNLNFDTSEKPTNTQEFVD